MAEAEDGSFNGGSRSCSTTESTPLIQGRSLAAGEYTVRHGDVSISVKSAKKSQQAKVTAVLLGATLAALVGTSAQFGYAIGMLDNIQPLIISDFQVNATCSSTFVIDHSASSASRRGFELATAMFCAGGLVGSLLGGWLCEKIGRKYSMLLNNIISFPSGMIMVFAAGFPMLIGGRFVQGVAAGVSMVAVPMYLGEISPTSMRGAIGTLNQVMITASITLATAVGLPYLLGTCRLWHIIVGAPVAFSALQVLTIAFFPRSPRFLYIQKSNSLAAESALRRLRGKTADISVDLAELQQEKRRHDSLPHMTVLQVLLDRKLRFRLLLTAILHMSQQLTGINGVFYYSRAIYTKAGLSHVALIALVPTIINVIFGIVSVRAVERLGRRKLMLLGLGGMCASHILLTCGFCFQDGFFSPKNGSDVNGANWTSALTIAGSLGVVTFFSLGPGPIPWMIVNELFPQQARAVAYSFAGVVNWTCNYLIGQFFLQILDGTHPYGFTVFATLSLLFAIALYFYQPETKGKEIEEIDSFFRRVASSEHARLTCCLTPGRQVIE